MIDTQTIEMHSGETNTFFAAVRDAKGERTINRICIATNINATRSAKEIHFYIHVR